MRLIICASQQFLATMESSAAPNKLSQFPGTPVATQQLSSTQATSTITTTNQEVPVSHSPAIVALQKATLKPQTPTKSTSTRPKMARDNGKRGSYRHVSSPETKVPYTNASHLPLRIFTKLPFSTFYLILLTVST